MYFKLSRESMDVFECVGYPKANEIVGRDARRYPDERGGYMCCVSEYTFFKTSDIVKVTRNGIRKLKRGNV